MSSNIFSNFWSNFFIDNIFSPFLLFFQQTGEKMVTSVPLPRRLVCLGFKKYERLVCQTGARWQLPLDPKRKKRHFVSVAVAVAVRASCTKEQTNGLGWQCDHCFCFCYWLGLWPKTMAIARYGAIHSAPSVAHWITLIPMFCARNAKNVHLLKQVCSKTMIVHVPVLRHWN